MKQTMVKISIERGEKLLAKQKAKVVKLREQLAKAYKEALLTEAQLQEIKDAYEASQLKQLDMEFVDNQIDNQKDFYENH